MTFEMFRSTNVLAVWKDHLIWQILFVWSVLLTIWFHSVDDRLYKNIDSVLAEIWKTYQPDFLFNFPRHTDRDCCIPLGGRVYITSCLPRANLIDSHGSYFVSHSQPSSSLSTVSVHLNPSYTLSVLTILFTSQFHYKACDRNDKRFWKGFPSKVDICDSYDCPQKEGPDSSRQSITIPGGWYLQSKPS